MASIQATPIHYGWVILAAGTFGSFMTLPGQTAGVSVFFDPITADLHISRTSASIAYAAGTLAGILPAPRDRSLDRQARASPDRNDHRRWPRFGLHLHGICPYRR